MQTNVVIYNDSLVFNFGWFSDEDWSIIDFGFLTFCVENGKVYSIDVIDFRFLKFAIYLKYWIRPFFGE